MVEAKKELTRRVLLLGEGNFSYALARCKLHLEKYKKPKKAKTWTVQPCLLQLIATSFDSLDEVILKYPEFTAIQQKMENSCKKGLLEVILAHGVDAT
jgi:hypothetical protein